MEGPGGLIVLILMFFPLFAGLFLLVRWLVLKKASGTKQRWPVTGILHRLSRRMQRSLGVSRFMPLWMRIAAIIGLFAFAQFGYQEVTNRSVLGEKILCSSPDITDGDTFRCDGQRIRLAGIDAPELEGHCRKGRKCTPGDPHAASDYLYSISRGTVSCRPTDRDVYGRTVARCEANGKDLSCAMIASGHAVRRYSVLICF